MARSAVAGAGLLLVLLLLLAGCAAQGSTAGPGGGPSPTDVATEVTAAPTETATPSPSATPSPTATPSPSTPAVPPATASPPGTDVADDGTGKAHEDALLALEAARADWAAAGLSDYTYQLTRSCFCPPELAGPWTVEVVDGEVTRVTAADGSPAADDAPIEVGPIESVHDAIAEMLASDPQSSTPSGGYDAVGLPVDLYVDPNPMMADEGATWSVALVERRSAD